MAGKRLIIVGGGPAGMMAGLLFARAGVETLVLEKHGDFLRDFRGDTVHPSTIELFDELGLAEAMFERPHDKVTAISARIGEERFPVADLSHLPVRHRFMMIMPQWDFLDFVRDEAERYPVFSLRLEAEVVGLTDEAGRVSGVCLANGETIGSDLVIAADGRSSLMREAAQLPRQDLGAPIDIFWFRVPKQRTPENQSMGQFVPGTIIAMIDRGDYWQCAFVLAKGGAEQIRAEGINAFRRRIAIAVPELADRLAAITSWDDVKLLSVELDRLTRWHRPGLLAIGDAAHAMSPVGGIGINLAIQDAVAAANILALPLSHGEPVDHLLSEVQARRILPVRMIQGIQRAAHNFVLGPVLGATQAMKPPFAVRLMARCPRLRRIPARLIGLGIQREHIRSPAVGGARQ